MRAVQKESNSKGKKNDSPFLRTVKHQPPQAEMNLQGDFWCKQLKDLEQGKVKRWQFNITKIGKKKRKTTIMAYQKPCRRKTALLHIHLARKRMLWDGFCKCFPSLWLSRKENRNLEMGTNKYLRHLLLFFKVRTKAEKLQNDYRTYFSK